MTLNTIDTTSKLNGFWFMDHYDQFISLLWNNGKFESYKISNGSNKIYEAYVRPNTVAAYSKTKKKLYVTSLYDLY